MNFRFKLNHLPWSTPWKLVLVSVLMLFGSASALAAFTSEEAFVINSFSFLLWGALVMWMCAGFTMLEAGSVRTKNASMICMKNIGLYSIAGLMYFLIGYNLMYVGVDATDWVGTFTLFVRRGNFRAHGRWCRAVRRNVGSRLQHTFRLVFPNGICRYYGIDHIGMPGRTR